MVRTSVYDLRRNWEIVTGVNGQARDLIAKCKQAGGSVTRWQKEQGWRTYLVTFPSGSIYVLHMRVQTASQLRAVG